jgi:hypothetical protein
MLNGESSRFGAATAGYFSINRFYNLARPDLESRRPPPASLTLYSSRSSSSWVPFFISFQKKPIAYSIQPKAGEAAAGYLFPFFFKVKS